MAMLWVLLLCVYVLICGLARVVSFALRCAVVCVLCVMPTFVFVLQFALFVRVVYGVCVAVEFDVDVDVGDCGVVDVVVTCYVCCLYWCLC